jgi:hypothetical protein
LIRLLPALLWLAAVAYALLVFRRASFAPRETDRTTVDVLFALGFLAVAVYGAYQAYRELMRALRALRADTSVWPVRPKPKPIPRHRRPLTDAARASLRQLIDALDAAGVLLPGEVSFEALVECAELEDEYATIDVHDALRILRAFEHERGQPFVNLAFFIDQCEYRAEDAAEMVREFARLCGKSAVLGAAIRVRGIDGGEIAPADGSSPPPNARVEFQLDGRPHVVHFVMYRKNLPLGLTDGLARAFAPAEADARRFVSGYFDHLAIAYLEPAKAATLNRTLSTAFDTFEVIRVE